MQIVFLCPPAGVINGGTKFIYRMAQILADAGVDVLMFEQNGQRPNWFESSLPIVGQGVLHPNPDQVFVVPEDQHQLLTAIRDWPQRKVMYIQNHFYAARGLGEAASFADYGINAILGSSETIVRYARHRHKSIPSFVVPCSVDTALFKPWPKRPSIAYMPRKRSIEALHLRDMFRFENPALRDWDWVAIHGQDQATVARMMGESSVFLSLSRLEGFGLTPLEAMAAGCVVAGFTGIGGREYADETNGFWADEDDFGACLTQIKRAIDLAATSDEAERARYAAATARTLSHYTPEAFRQGTLQAWTKILG